MLSDLAYVSEWVAAIVALLFYKKYRHTAMRPILWILWVVVAIEVCVRIKTIRIEGTNHLYYNCYLLTVFPLLYYTIYRHIIAPHRKKQILIVSVITIAIIIARACTTPFLTLFMLYMYILAMIALIINLMIYAVDLLKNNTRIILKHKLELFIFSGFMLFGISYIPLSFILTSEDFLQLSGEAINVLSSIQNSTVILMNVIFVFGFIWANPIGNNSN